MNTNRIKKRITTKTPNDNGGGLNLVGYTVKKNFRKGKNESN